VFQRAQEGDRNAVPELRRLVRSKRWGGELVFYAGAPEIQLIDALIGRFSHGRGAPDNFGIRTAMEERMAALERELTPTDVSPLERLLVKGVVVCWLAWCDAEYAAVWGSQPGATSREREALGRYSERAHRRLLAAVKALASFRRADAPGLVLNVTQQVAAIGGTPAAPASLPIGNKNRQDAGD
jgi:hypothetical protein